MIKFQSILCCCEAGHCVEQTDPTKIIAKQDKQMSKCGVSDMLVNGRSLIL